MGMGGVIDAVRLKVVAAKDKPDLDVDMASAFQCFMWKDASGIFIKLGDDSFLYMSAGKNPHSWVGSKPLSGLPYIPVDLTVQTHEDA